MFPFGLNNFVYFVNNVLLLNVFNVSFISLVKNVFLPIFIFGVNILNIYDVNYFDLSLKEQNIPLTFGLPRFFRYHTFCIWNKILKF